MTDFLTLALADAPIVTAPDGLTVRPLLVLDGGSLARFELPAGLTGRAVVHRTVEEIWFVTAGGGEMWRGKEGAQEVTPLVPGTSLAIPVGTAFQVRAGDAGLTAIAVTMPPWPGEDEARPAEGPWTATV